jgi:bifunctional non-homologous end joining protein LigD
MSLKPYHEKRRFDRTPEPRGKRHGRRAVPRFVVQKHQASRLHYDLRLEMDGVLKSWAVPKGPSLDPADKRLAIQVEDHPLEYGHFEGTIPAGNYGAGTVMLWDEGTFESAKDGQTLLEGWQVGHLHVILHGSKLRGEFSLVRIKGETGNNWLLMKHRDAFASPDIDVLAQDRSARTERTMAEIAGAGTTWDGKARKRRSAHRPVPKFTGSLLGHAVKPMLAAQGAEPFDRKGWLFEIKWDGERAFAEVARGRVKLYGRERQSLEGKFAPIERSLAKLGHDAVFDGAIVVLDEKGRASIPLLHSYQATGKGALVYLVFDLLFLDGKDLREKPLALRKEMLTKLLKNRDSLQLSEHVEQHGNAFFQAASKQGLEGIIAKNGASPYREGKRGRAWLKINTRSPHSEAPKPGVTRSSNGLPPGKFTNLTKVFWPDEGYTKGDVLRYYHDVASLILPHLRDRPMSLNRHPNGIRGPSFFQKDMSHQPPPAWAQTALLPSDSTGKEIAYLLCQNEETLLYIANLGCIEINPWNSRLGSLDEPDYLILDLDPQDVPFKEVTAAAQHIRKLLEKAGAACYCKTSGKRGLHVFLPLGAKYNYDVVRRFAEIIARAVHAKLPQTTSILRQPALRRHRVYLDYLQNRRGQTIAAPYSLRPVPGALVSTPLYWREVNARLDPAEFNLETIQRRLDRVGDLWKQVLGKGINVEACLQKLNERA